MGLKELLEAFRGSVGHPLEIPDDGVRVIKSDGNTISEYTEDGKLVRIRPDTVTKHFPRAQDSGYDYDQEY